MNAPELLDVLDKLGQPNVLVVGDLILDLYTWGDAERISQEAPVILLRADRREKRLGGAANVCQMLRGLEANVMCAGIVGRDEAGQWVIDRLVKEGVECQALLTDAGRPTTTKERFIGRAEGRHPHQILRVDNEVRRAMADDLESQLIELVCNKLSTADVVLVSDYGKGVCSPSLLRAVIDTARQHGVPVVVDPIKAKNFSVYRGATAITPNRSEAEVATDSKIKSSTDASAAAERIIEQADLQAGFITLDRDGMALARRGEPTEIFSTRPRAVYDITGAGDIVLATIGICTAARVDPRLAAQLANVAGGLEVEQIGVAVIQRSEIRSHLLSEIQPSTGKILPCRELVDRLQAQRRGGQKIVFTNGCFDLLHVGHITYLQQAATLGDVLVIGLNSDSSVRELKGPTRPVIGQQDRAAMLSALMCVGFVVLFEEQTPLRLIEQILPDILVKGGDYTADQVIGRECVESQGGQIVILPLVDGVSTTKIIKSVAA
ncbi:MAG: D-glycero-beta-D-manno-heptose 1-phosphate adenylyltransferase [Pirellulales bacterium]